MPRGIGGSGISSDSGGFSISIASTWGSGVPSSLILMVGGAGNSDKLALLRYPGEAVSLRTVLVLPEVSESAI